MSKEELRQVMNIVILKNCNFVKWFVLRLWDIRYFVGI